MKRIKDIANENNLKISDLLKAVKKCDRKIRDKIKYSIWFDDIEYSVKEVEQILKNLPGGLTQ